MKKRDLTGQRFGQLTVINESPVRIDQQVCWICKCDCGNITPPLIGSNLTRGHTKSCGCLHKPHGDYYTRLYWVWCSMKKRCYDKNHPTYRNYGRRGIKVCEEWKHDFKVFREWALQSGYVAGHGRGECSLDRIDVNGDYCPENCRWVSMKVQQNNRRNNVQG